MRVLGAWAAFSPRWQAPTQRTRKQIDVSFDSKKASVSRSRSSHRSPKSVQAPYYIPHTQLHVADVPVVDAIVILAGGQDESRMSQLPVWVERRLDACASLIQHQPSTTKILCSGGGACPVSALPTSSPAAGSSSERIHVPHLTHNPETVQRE